MKKVFFGLAVVLFSITSFVFAQNTRSIIGVWSYTAESELSGMRIVDTNSLTFKNDGTFVLTQHSVIYGGEMDGQEGTVEIINGKYKLQGSRLTIDIDAPLSGHVTDTCMVTMTKNTLELTGFENMNNQFWFGTEYDVKWFRAGP